MLPIKLQPTLTPDDAVNDLIEKGVACVRLPDDVHKASDEVFLEAYNFFSNAEMMKEKCASPDVLEGWRGIGSEFDPNSGRPDLSEAFTVWFRNGRRPDVMDWAIRCPLHRSMTKALNPCAILIEDLLNTIRCRLDPTCRSSNRDSVAIRDFSYLQLNFSRPAKQIRDTITDTHEDGHLLTFLRPSDTGLMIARGELVEAPTPTNPAGIFRPVEKLRLVVLKDDEGLVIPSSPTFYLTGGLIPPLFHCVANHGHVVRQSMVFFVNPSPTQPLIPWYRTPLNEGVRIHDVVDYISGQYGQPAISQTFKD